MKKPKSFRKTSKGLLGALSIAGGTTAYGAVAVVAPPADLTNTPGGTNKAVNWDVNSDGINDFTFQNRYPNTTAGNGVVWQMNMNPATGASATNGVVSYPGSFVQYAFALQPGATIGTSSTFSVSVTQITLGSKYTYSSSPSYYGGFAADGRTPVTTANGAVTPGTFAFAGFRFTAADGIHYGYIKLAVSAGLIDFVSAAYQTTPLTNITAGAVPEPGTLALLAFGAAAVGAVARRRRA